MPEIYKAYHKNHTHKPHDSKLGQVETGLKPSGGMLSAFMIKPNGVRFETQDDQEEILLFMRRHHVTNVGWLIITFILLIAPSFVFTAILKLNLLPKDMPMGYYLLIPWFWYLLTFGFAFTRFLYWYYNVYIVTNKRVVDIDWYSLLYKQLSSTTLDKIQDVTYKQGGILDSFFDFGTVFVQTAGSERNFEFEAVPHPEKVVRQINEIAGIKKQ